MENERNSKCWYKEVCQLSSCENCLRYLEMNYLMEHSGVPKNQRRSISLVPDDCDYDAFCDLADIKDDILNFVQSGKSLYICSENTGNGKTSWALKLLFRYFDQIWAGNGLRVRGMIVHVPSFLLKLKQFDDADLDSYKKRILDCDLVIWDDIASTKLSSYDNSQLLLFLDQRIFAGKSNIYTGNIITEDDLTTCVGIRLCSRIWKSSKVVKFFGKDRRSL